MAQYRSALHHWEWLEDQWVAIFARSRMARLRGNQRLFWKRATAAWKCDDPSACVSCRRRPARRGEFPPASDAPRPAPAQGVLRRAREVAAGRGLACPRRIPPQSLEHRHLLDDAAPVPVQGAQECPPDVLAAHRLDVRQVGLVERVRENAGYRHQVDVPLGIARELATASAKAAGDGICGGPASAAIGDPRDSR